MSNIFTAIYARGKVFAGPTADGTSGQAIVTDASGNLSFATVSGGVSSLNSLTGALAIAVGTSGSDVAVSASGSTVTVNIPDAGASARGVLTTGTQTIAGAKTFTGTVGINTTAPDKQLEINSATGDCLRLTYNDSNGSAAYRTDLYVSNAGNLGIAPSGGTTTFNGNIDINDIVFGANAWWRMTATYSVGNRFLELASANTGAVSFRHYSDTGIMYFGSKVGVGTVLPDKQVEINSQTGDCLRLTYNDSNGSAANYVDQSVSSGGSFTITPSGTTITLAAGVSVGAVTFAVLNATTATATLGIYRITDRGNKLAYPDGTNWRFVVDDAIIS